MIRTPSSFSDKSDPDNRRTSFLNVSQKEVKNNYYVWCIAIFVSIGAMMFGLDQGNFSGVQINLSFINDWCTIPDAIGGGFGTLPECNSANTADQPNGWISFKSLAAALITIGCAVGALCVAPPLVKNYGRRLGIAIGTLLATVATVVVLVTKSIPLFYVGRISNGIGLGIVTYAMPMYVAEIAPPSIRGVLGSLFQMGVVLGITFANLFNLFKIDWRFSLGLPIIPATVVIFGIYACPPSPRYLIQHQGEDKAREALVRLRGTNNVDEELNEMTNAAKEDQQSNDSYFSIIGDLLCRKTMRKRFIIAVMLQFLQQFTGINAFFTYSATIFKQAGVEDPLAAALYLAIANIAGTVAALWFVDSQGRRKLLLIGAGAMVLFMGLLAIFVFLNDEGYISNTYAAPFLIVWSCCYVIGFAIGWGPVPWLYPSEIFPTRVKEVALSYSVFSQWMANFVINMVVPSMLSNLGTIATFLIFCGTCFLAGVYTFFQIPETKGVKLEDMGKLFGDESEHHRKAKEAYIPLNSCLSSCPQ